MLHSWVQSKHSNIAQIGHRDHNAAHRHNNIGGCDRAGNEEGHHGQAPGRRIKHREMGRVGE